METPPLAELPRCPAVGGTCLIALGIFAFASPEQVEPLQLDLRAFGPEPWRLLTSTLLHAGQLRGERWLEGLAHAGFNCYWLWRFGAGLEQRLGHLRTLALIALFGVAGATLEYAFTGPAVGLSGVVYGFVALLWVLARRSPSWRGAIDTRTAQFFGFWFGFCVIATITGVLPIANFAHAGGAAVGALVGWAMTERGARRSTAIAAIVASLALLGVGATAARPWINISKFAGLDAMVQAERAVANDDLERAIAWAERGVGYWRTPADHWAYLAWLHLKRGDYRSALAAQAEAVRRDPNNGEYQRLLEQLQVLGDPP